MVRLAVLVHDVLGVFVWLKWVGVQVGSEPQTELYIKWAIRYNQTLGTDVFQSQLYIKWAELGLQIYI